ncbi:DUF1360 domain-containing protein [Cytobacillus depressus]|uniref:DUF1360 domain-containing protein n=1 Tax=Cytobacillus depressus TaxID=1602942 RepID=A0A6L3V8X2_9BACI|nr:DUF1360 domain-containing protein [Cytobacillus depressus]KAB2337235.1 DUF1360 domain-containing protein [Cytobacillus depressus]
MEITLSELMILALASFRLTRLVVYDKITEFLRSPFFDEIEEKNNDGESEIYLIPKKGGIRGFLGDLLSCYWCTGIWSTLFLYIVFIYFPKVIPIIVILAVAGIAAIIETVVQKFINE